MPDVIVLPIASAPSGKKTSLVGADAFPIGGGQYSDMAAVLAYMEASLDKISRSGANGNTVFTAASNTLTPAHRGTRLVTNSAAANEVVLDTNANQAIPIGAGFDLWQWGAGLTTLRALGGVTLNGSGGGAVVVPARYRSPLYFFKIGANEWLCTSPS